MCRVTTMILVDIEFPLQQPATTKKDAEQCFQDLSSMRIMYFMYFPGFQGISGILFGVSPEPIPLKRHVNTPSSRYQWRPECHREDGGDGIG